MGKFIIVMGVSGCGKSTIGERLAEAIGAVYLEGDSYHPPENVTKMASAISLTDDDRWPWFDSIIAAAQTVISEGKSAVVACSALKRKYRDYLFRDFGEECCLVFLDGSFELIETRMNARKGHFMKSTLLKSQFETLEVPDNEQNVFHVSIEEPPEKVVSSTKNWLENR